MGLGNCEICPYLYGVYNGSGRMAIEDDISRSVDYGPYGSMCAKIQAKGADKGALIAPRVWRYEVPPMVYRQRDVNTIGIPGAAVIGRCKYTDAINIEGIRTP